MAPTKKFRNQNLQKSRQNSSPMIKWDDLIGDDFSLPTSTNT